MSELEQQFFEGMDVYDAEEHKIGTLVRYDHALGYFEALGSFAGVRYVPYYAIENVAPTGIRLNVTKDVVSHVYDHAPSITPGFTPSGKLTGGGTVESGHEPGRRVPLDAAALSVVRERIGAGTPVLDAADDELGTVDGYDADTGYMRIKKGWTGQKDIFLPVTAVAFVDDRGIHLSLGRATVMSRFTRLPGVAREFFAR